jgi:heme-degrading monooxygenase HmoA
MILEIADIRIKPGQQAAFEEAIRRGVATVVSQAKGMRGYKVNKGIESPERYVLQIFWDKLEDHTVAFREGPLFAQWRAIVGPFFASPPIVEHFELVMKSPQSGERPPAPRTRLELVLGLHSQGGPGRGIVGAEQKRRVVPDSLRGAGLDLSEDRRAELMLLLR